MTTLPAIPDDDLFDTGLEDFNESDMAMPTLDIDHNKGVFVNGLSGEEYSALNIIILGVVKQRTLWPAEVGESKERPLCRSLNFTEGLPGDKFPWKASGFSADAYSGPDAKLPCEGCKLKEWGTHPKRDNIPWCGEEYALAILILDDDGSILPAVLVLKRSSIKDAKKYLSVFKAKGTGAFTNVTEISLSLNRRGTVNYATANFKMKDATNQADWPAYASRYRGIRAFLQAPRRRDEDEAEAEAPTAAAPAGASTKTVADDDEIPF